MMIVVINYLEDEMYKIPKKLKYCSQRKDNMPYYGIRIDRLGSVV